MVDSRIATPHQAACERAYAQHAHLQRPTQRRLDAINFVELFWGGLIP
jgi:hypothetical protein